MTAFIQKLLVGFALSSSLLLAETMTVEGTTVTFEAPADFKPLSEEIIALKWPSHRAPNYAVGNEAGSTTIAYDYKADVTGATLPVLKTQFTAVFDQSIPGIEWIKNEIVMLDGEEWIMFEMTSNAVDTDIHNLLLVTILEDTLLMFNFNSVKHEFPQYEAALRESIESIRFNR